MNTIKKFFFSKELSRTAVDKTGFRKIYDTIIFMVVSIKNT
ncbi:hypothetical protein [Flavobacterium sp.]